MWPWLFIRLKIIITCKSRCNYTITEHKIISFCTANTILKIVGWKCLCIHIYIYIWNFSVGYTMSDIRYKWNDGLNSVQISSDVSLPQFKVLGHRQKTIEASLSTGGSEIHLKYSLKLKWISIPLKTDISFCSWNWFIVILWLL